MELRNKEFPASRQDGYLKLAEIYTRYKKDDVKAAAAYKGAFEATAEKNREALRKQIPPQFQASL